MRKDRALRVLFPTVRGDVGTVVHVYADGTAFEVEFVTLDGQTVAVATVDASSVRPVTGRDITHSRELTIR